MNPQSLLEQFLGPDMVNSAGQAAKNAKGSLANSGMGGIAGGLAAGGVLGLLLGNKKARKKVGKMAGGVVGYGGAAALGALAYRAYQNWQDGQKAPQGASAGVPAAAGAQTQAPVAASGSGLPIVSPPGDSKFLPAAQPAGDGRPFELALVMAMIAAANADGHIGPDEQGVIFEKVGQLPLDSEDKGFVFDALAKPPSLQDIADLAQGPEQAAELYLASRMAIDPDHPMEQAYLDALASRLSLPGELVGHLESQIDAATA